MRIAFFGDGSLPRQAALLAAYALAVASDPPVLQTCCGKAAAAELESARADERDAFLALPLEVLSDEALRRASTLAVVVAGPARHSIERARAFATEAAAVLPATMPAWFLVRRTVGCREPIPGIGPMLPVRLPLLSAAYEKRLDGPALPGRLRLEAARLGAVLALAASDPSASAVRSGRLKDAFAGYTAADIELRRRLTDLAAQIDDTSRPFAERRRLGAQASGSGRRRLGHPTHRPAEWRPVTAA